MFEKLKETKNELKLISWPSKKEVNQTILIVLILIVLTSACFWFIDSILVYIISQLV
jgi:preprotein translocase subunit SecE